MNSYSKKRKAELKTYKAIRNSIILNNTNPIPSAHAKVNFNNLTENQWLEQYNEIMEEQQLVNQKLTKNTKIIVRWWEN